MPRLLALGARQPGIRDECERDDEREEGQRVEGEEHRVARRVLGGRDQAAGDAAETDSQIAHHALERKGRMPAGLRGEARDQRRLARPEGAVSDAADGGEQEGLPGLAHQRVAAEADREHHERDDQRALAAEAVDDRCPRWGRSTIPAAALVAAISPTIGSENPRTLCR